MPLGAHLSAKVEAGHLTSIGREPDEAEALPLKGEGPVPLSPAVELKGRVADVVSLGAVNGTPGGDERSQERNH